MPKFLRNLKNYLFSLSLKQTLSLVFLIALLISIPISVYGVVTQRMLFQKKAAQPLSPEDLIRKSEPSNRKFTRLEVDNKTVYFHQRMIGKAIVEKNFINYQFDKKTGALLEKKSHWQPDLPEQLPPLKITEKQAKSMVRGRVQFTKLLIISPESDVFPLKPTPKNPCWVVSSIKDEINILTVIDAVTGQQLGYGVPPPSSPPSRGLSLSGPQYFSPCSGEWSAWYLSAKGWFEKMGYPTATLKWPTVFELWDHLGGPLTTLFYETAHGSSFEIKIGCSDSISYSTIWQILKDRDKIPFSFLASCNGMCYPETSFGIPYQLRKGSEENCVTVGYCGMGQSSCFECWLSSLLWQEALFNYIYEGNTVKVSFDKALADYLECAIPNCMRFAGDENYKIPVIAPTPSPSPSPSPQPDLVITRLELSMASPTSLKPTSLKIDYQLSNQGQVDAPATKTYFYIDGKYKFYDEDPEIPAGQSTPLLFYYGWSCTKESHTMKLCADGRGTVQESDEENNCLEKILICPNPSPSPLPLPNLKMYDIKFYKPRTTIEATPKAGKLVTAFAVMKNTGTKDTGVFNVKWFLNDQQVGYGSHVNLPSGQESQGNVRFDWTPESGVHYLRFSADVDGNVKESNEDDNQVVRQVVVE